jgi:hypothetical protein
MRSLRWYVAGVAIAVTVTATPVFADTVLLKNGRMISGKIVREDGEKLTLEVLDGQGRIVIHKATVERVWKGDQAPPPARQGIFPANETAPVSSAPPSEARNALAQAATCDLEARLRSLGPPREDLIAQLQPTPDEAAALAQLERGLASGDAKDVARLAAKGRLAIVVAARALAGPDRRVRIGAAQLVVTLAGDERALPFLLALGVPEALLAAAADEADGASPVARLEARRALAAIAKTGEDVESAPATSQALAAEEKERLEGWQGWWRKQKDELDRWERDKEEERARIRAELVRRGLRAYETEKKGRIEVRLTAAAEEPSLPEPRLVLPRLVLVPPTDLAIEGEGPKRVLRFATTIENRGEGALEIRRSGLGEADLRAVQRVFASYPGDARLVVEHETTVGCLAWHAVPGHFDLAGALRHELLDESFSPALGALPVEAGCSLHDARPILPDATAKVRYADGAKDVQGISPGFACVLARSEPGQAVPLGRLPDGIYYLVTALAAGFEPASAADDRLAAAEVRISGTTVALVAALDGRALVALERRRQEALGGH